MASYVADSNYWTLSPQPSSPKNQWLFVSTSGGVTIETDTDGSKYYHLGLSAKIWNKYDLNVNNWNNGQNSTLTITASCNGQSWSNSTSNIPAMNNKYGGETYSVLSISVDIKNTNTLPSLTVSTHLDCTGVIGTNGSRGIYFQNAGVNIISVGQYGHIDSMPTLYTAPKDLSCSITDVTGTTLTCKPTWTEGSATSTATVILKNSQGGEISRQTTTTSGTSLKFTGLSNNTYYIVSCSSSDGTTSLTASDSSRTTFGVNISDTSVGTYWLKAKCSWNQAPPSNRLIYRITNSSGAYVVGDTEILNGSTISFNTTTSTYTITCWIKDMSDAISSVSLTLKTLSVVNTGITPSQFGITSSWQAKADTYTNTDDNISFRNYKTYLNGDVHATAVGSTTGTYKHLTTTRLESFTNYIVWVEVTDGYNTATAIAATRTLYPYAKVFYNGRWHNAEVYIHNGNSWRLVKGYVHNGSSWREFNNS